MERERNHPKQPQVTTLLRTTVRTWVKKTVKTTDRTNGRSKAETRQTLVANRPKPATAQTQSPKAKKRAQRLTSPAKAPVGIRWARGPILKNRTQDNQPRKLATPARRA